MIKLLQGFDIRQPLPIDGRILLSKHDMCEIDDNVFPERYFAFCKDDGKLYLYYKENVATAETGKFRLADDDVIAKIESELNNYINEEDLELALEDYSTIEEAGNKIEFRMDPGFILKLLLKNSDGEVLDEGEIDLPLEQLVVDAEYDEERNVIILYVQSETSEIKDIEIPLGDLVSSLVSKDEFRAHADNEDLHVSDEERLRWNDAAEHIEDALRPDDLHMHILAGENVHLDVSDNGDITINADDTTYTAGEGINIIDGEISAQASAPTWTDIQTTSMIGPMDNEALANLFNAKQDILTAGNGIAIENNVISNTQTSAEWGNIEGNISDQEDLAQLLEGKQDVIEDLATIREKANEGSTAVQPGDLSSVATSGDYGDLINKPELSDVALSGSYEDLEDLPELSDVALSGSYNDLEDKPELFSGSYNDLTNKPHIPADQVNADWEANSGVAQILNKPNLAAVATSGSYNDLSNKPSIPAAQVNANWNASSGVAQILNKPELAAVATSGSYNDLNNKPTIPTVPTNVSAFNNDAGYLTSFTETDPTVPAWAKEANKPSYTYSEISGKPTLATVATSGSYNDLTNKPTIPAAQVNSDWNASSGVAQILNKPTIPTVPTNVSAFNNDAGYLTSFTETDPTVPAWAKASTKPTYTAVEVGAIPDTTNVVTSITVNGSSKTPTSGAVDLGTVVNAGDGIAVSANNTVGINSVIKLSIPNSGWTTISSPTAGAFGYSKTISNANIKGGNPIIDFDTSTYTTAAEYQEYLADYNKIYRAVASNGSITFYAVTIPSHSIYVNIMGC